MEGSESEAIFDSLNLNPQLFLNEILNMVDDVAHDAFHFFHREASQKLHSERSQHLSKAVDGIRNVIQADLDKRLAIWEKYCLRHCFSVPHSFVMQRSDNSIDGGSIYRSPFDPETDAQLDSLRKKLTEVGKESAMLDQEIKLLERQSNSNSGLINEILPLHDQNALHELFNDITTTASELGTKLGNLKSDMTEQAEQRNVNRIYSKKIDLHATDYAKGLSSVKFENLQEFLNAMKNV